MVGQKKTALLVGGMGPGLVKNLVKNGASVRVFNFYEEAMAPATHQSAEPASCACDAARDVDVFMICVTTAAVASAELEAHKTVERDAMGRERLWSLETKLLSQGFARAASLS